jgi:tetratricopeptide (TPR) repeat protein
MLRIALVLAAVLPMATSARGDENVEAKQHYERGATAYEANDYATARTEFLAAWELSHKPVILFDLARVETKLGHDEKAIAYLRQYLNELPDAVDAVSIRTEIEARERALSERKARVEAEHQAQSVRREAEAQRAADAARASLADERKRRQLGVAGWSLFGGGLAIVVGGIVCGVLAEHDASTVQSGGAPAGATTTPPPFAGSPSSTASQGQLTQSLGIALDVIGGVAAAAGIGLVVVSKRGGVRARAAVAPTYGGAAVVGSF